MLYADRTDAGRRLAAKLAAFRDRPGVLVLGLPRGGVPVAYEVAPARIVVAVPVGARETCAEFQNEADEVVCGATPDPFYAVGYWYGNFEPTTDDTVRALLARAQDAAAPAAR